MNTYRIVTGDWSNDGHNQKDFFTVKTSHEIAEIQTAYRIAVNKSAIALDHQKKTKFQLFCEYEDSSIPAEAVKILTELGVDWSFRESKFNNDGSLVCSPQDVAHLFMQMVKTQIPDFQYELVEEPPCINGFWGKLNIGIGYGCYN